MPKKRETRHPAKTEAVALTHNPFARLGGLANPTREPSTSARDEVAHVAETREAQTLTKSRGRLVLRRETKHRGGKAVIVVTGFAALPSFTEADVQALAKELKQRLACGGTVEGNDERREIVLQGDRAATVADLLRACGFRVDGVTS